MNLSVQRSLCDGTQALFCAKFQFFIDLFFLFVTIRGGTTVC